MFKGNFNFYIDSNSEYDVLLFNKLTKQYYIKPKYFIQYDQFNNKYNEVVNISNFLFPLITIAYVTTLLNFYCIESKDKILKSLLQYSKTSASIKNDKFSLRLI